MHIRHVPRGGSGGADEPPFFLAARGRESTYMYSTSAITRTRPLVHAAVRAAWGLAWLKATHVLCIHHAWCTCDDVLRTARAVRCHRCAAWNLACMTAVHWCMHSIVLFSFDKRVPLFLSTGTWLSFFDSDGPSVFVYLLRWTAVVFGKWRQCRWPEWIMATLSR